MRQKSSVVIFCLIKDNQLLIETRPVKGLKGKHILIPGGTVRDSEDLEAAMQREMMEELGILPLEFEVLAGEEISGLHNNILKPFLIKSWQGEIPEIGLDKEDPYPLSWMEINQVINVPIAPTRLIAQRIKEYLLAERGRVSL